MMNGREHRNRECIDVLMLCSPPVLCCCCCWWWLDAAGGSFIGGLVMVMCHVSGPRLGVAGEGCHGQNCVLGAY